MSLWSLKNRFGSVLGPVKVSGFVAVALGRMQEVRVVWQDVDDIELQVRYVVIEKSVCHSQAQSVLGRIASDCNLFAEGHVHTKEQNEESDCTVVLVLLVFVVGQTLKVTAEETTHNAADEARMYLGVYSADYVHPGFDS